MYDLIGLKAGKPVKCLQHLNFAPRKKRYYNISTLLPVFDETKFFYSFSLVWFVSSFRPGLVFSSKLAIVYLFFSFVRIYSCILYTFTFFSVLCQPLNSPVMNFLPLLHTLSSSVHLLQSTVSAPVAIWDAPTRLSVPFGLSRINILAWTNINTRHYLYNTTPCTHTMYPVPKNPDTDLYVCISSLDYCQFLGYPSIACQRATTHASYVMHIMTNSLLIDLGPLFISSQSLLGSSRKDLV